MVKNNHISWRRR